MQKKWQPRRILAVKQADLGDSLLITPALRALKATYPSARIDVLTSKGASALEGLPYLDRVILFDKHRYDQPRDAFKPANLVRAFKFLANLSLARYDAVILFHHLALPFGALKFAALTLSTFSPIRVGLDNAKGRAWFLNRKVADRGFGAKNEREYWLDLAAALGAKLPEGDGGGVELVVSEADRIKAHRLTANIGPRPLIALAPGSGNYSLARRWLPARFARVADELVERQGAHILIMGSPEELELASEICNQMRQSSEVTILAGSTTVSEAVAVLEQCKLFIGNDGGSAHLASVAGIAGLIIFGPSNARAWKPFGKQMVVVEAPINLPCRPCLYTGFELGSRTGCASRPCLTFINPEQVLEEAEKLLDHSHFR